METSILKNPNYSRMSTVWPLIAVLLLMLPAVVQAQFTYTINNGTITITGYTGFGGAVAIPATILGLPVTGIGDYAFSGNTDVTSVTIPNSVTRIGYSAFSDCTSLTSVTIPNSVTNIGVAPFAYCLSLSAIAVDVVNSFYSSVDGVLFNKSQSLLIQYPAAKAGSYTIPNSVITIGGVAFSGCTSLASVTIPNSVTSIGGYAFDSSESLTSVTIPGSVTNIGSSAFFGCTSLTAITADAANAYYSSLDGVLLDKSQTKLIEYPGGKAGSYTIPGSVTSIGDEAFARCMNLSSVTIPGGVTSIGAGAFEMCISLANITIPGSVTSIRGGAFQYCTSLASITVPASVTNIGDYAFQNCYSLTNVTILNGVIGFGMFSRCTALTGVFFKGNAPSVGFGVFDYASPTVYYLPGTTGWDATFVGRPTRLWNPLMQSSGLGPAGFGFNITGTANIPIVVEATTNLANGPWVPLQSLNLPNGTFYFSDPNWANYPTRNYRIRSP